MREGGRLTGGGFNGGGDFSEDYEICCEQRVWHCDF
jgi:hypothetical protein